MELSKPKNTLVALILPAFTFSVMSVPRVPPDDFNRARLLIDQMKPNINYSTFCSEKATSGHHKVPCRIKKVPSVGFMVCRRPELGEEGRREPCRDAILAEITNINRVSEEGNVKTVQIDDSPEPIDGVPCGDNPGQLSCSGFLEEWVIPELGRFEQIRNRIVEGRPALGQMIAEVKTFTTSAGLSTTATDLVIIKNYMMLNPTANKYRQICDLQGFFLVNGGFVVNDISYIRDGLDESREGIGKNERCWNEPHLDPTVVDREPSTAEVLSALDKMITAFSASG